VGVGVGGGVIVEVNVWLSDSVRDSVNDREDDAVPLSEKLIVADDEAVGVGGGVMVAVIDTDGVRLSLKEKLYVYDDVSVGARVVEADSLGVRESVAVCERVGVFESVSEYEYV
jgi:hypothetical protein